jgi:hypothetical protein
MCVCVCFAVSSGPSEVSSFWIPGLCVELESRDFQFYFAEPEVLHKRKEPPNVGNFHQA